MATKLFKDYYSRLAKEGFIKALMCGLIIGFAVMFLSAAIFWFTGFNKFWLSIVLWAASTVVATPLFYRFKFRPTAKAIAMRVDELGLEERILTMNQLEGDDSYIAMKQREDAIKALNSVNAKNIKIAVSIPLVIALSIIAVFGMGMTTVTALSSNGSLPGPNEIIGSLADPEYFEVVFEAEGEGLIEAEPVQIIESGNATVPVTAVPEPGWMFTGWSTEFAAAEGFLDNVMNPTLQITNVTQDMIFIAIFEEAGDEDSDAESDSEGEPGEPGESDGKPGDSNSSSGQDGNTDNSGQNMPSNSENSDSSGQGEGEGSEGSESEGEGDSEGQGGGAGGTHEDRYQVINKETYYGDVYDEYYQKAMEDLENGDYTEEEKQQIIDYWNSIKP